MPCKFKDISNTIATSNVQFNIFIIIIIVIVLIINNNIACTTTFVALLLRYDNNYNNPPLLPARANTAITTNAAPSITIFVTAK